MSSVPVVIKPRLAVPEGVDPGEWNVLTKAIYPNARSAESVMLAMAYCKARNLDIMKRPVNIVSLWDNRANNGEGGFVDQFWPSINETQATAARTGVWAGMDKPVWGPEITVIFEGERFVKRGEKKPFKVEVTFPEWCEVTVYRMVDGQRCPFTDGPVYWREAYGRVGGSDLPNDMWQKRPHGQLQKVAKAASLRAAFPEEGGYDESELEGQTVNTAEIDITPPKPKDNWKPPSGSPGSDQRSDRRDDRGGDRDDEPPPHTAAPEGPQRTTTQDNGEAVDTATGEVVGPQVVAKGADEGWIEWAQRFLARVITSTTEDEIKAWGEHNKDTLEALSKPPAEGGGPKVYERLQSAINKHRMSLTLPPKKEGEVTIIGAG